MKVFISWSGRRSKAVAEALHDWLPSVMQAVRPWMSAEDIEAGARWSADVARELEETRFGIICLTPENRDARWILFEAGALSKTVQQTRVCPYLFDLQPSSLEGPLVQFQAVVAHEEGTRKLVRSINLAAADQGLPEARLDKTFDVWWCDLRQRLEAVPQPEQPARPEQTERPEREMVEEILSLVRDQARSTAAHTFGSSRGVYGIDEPTAVADRRGRATSSEAIVPRYVHDAVAGLEPGQAVELSPGPGETLADLALGVRKAAAALHRPYTVTGTGTSLTVSRNK